MGERHREPGGLLLAMHAGDGEAARALWDAHAGRLIALGRAITGSSADGADAVQEAFMGVLRLTRSQAAGVEDEAAYLAAAVRRCALNLLRSASRRSEHERSARPLRLVGCAGVDEELQAAVDALPLEKREVVALKHFAGLTFEQMGVVLGEPRSTVAGRYAAAIEVLRAAVMQRTEVARANG